ncbi:CarD family transcriptional regulator [Treponema pallidum]|uniref:Transcription factor (CarD) n=5 Tax=Treponema pallidum TaxID=160 RepID=O83524_TREPA|nr:CarD family transcriptional regulator [Treponema pallidum]AAC65499.1 transcription factor (carD) [Treponema pallidum subsp. pallidum str. Nichols]ACD70934.1 transcription factor [Treponema pallidum subsp. pallidum SS14]AFU66510.1 CarD family transcriptional regulator [Treponema pallidum subsp. pallidum str. Mexico A]AGN75700.1 CarD family transcriptional regulator [Treponema pallidum subsp. pallidum str. Nichols]AGN76676.1 CarD family transcriptional regulator [Treponema pallidum subsp. pal
MATRAWWSSLVFPLPLPTDFFPCLCYAGPMGKACAFRPHDHVVYPGQGVGQVQEISEKTFKNETLLYYVIYLEESDMTVLIPVDKAQELGIRTIVKRKEAERALRFLSEDFDPSPLDWKMRYQVNLNLFKSGGILDNAAVVRSLYHRSKVKELPIQERRLYDSAYRIFQDEMCFALGLRPPEVETLIHGYLEKAKENPVVSGTVDVPG